MSSVTAADPEHCASLLSVLASQKPDAGELIGVAALGGEGDGAEGNPRREWPIGRAKGMAPYAPTTYDCQRIRWGNLAGCVNQTCSAGQAIAGAETNPRLILQINHSAGAD